MKSTNNTFASSELKKSLEVTAQTVFKLKMTESCTLLQYVCLSVTDSGTISYTMLSSIIIATTYIWIHHSQSPLTVSYGRPMEQGRPLYFCPVVSSSSFFFSSPNLSRRRLDVCHTSTHGVALVRI